MTSAAELPGESFALGGLFAPAERSDWERLVAPAALLGTTSYDGVQILPLYTADDAAGLEPGLPGPVPADGWDVRQRHAHPDPDVTREAVISDLENGVTSLWLVLGEAGLPIGCLDDVLRDVQLDLAPVVLDAGADTEAAAQELLALMARRGLGGDSIRGNLGADPIGLRARTGAGSGHYPDLALVARLARRCLDEAPNLRAVTVDATAYHDAGGSDAEELGASLATGVSYLRALTGAGLSLTDAFGQLEFRYCAGPDQFLTIAKVRAARRLWARVADVCGLPGSDGGAAGQVQHAVTSSAMMTRRDPWVNLLRCTVACFGAGVGGARAITVQPFDAAIGLPDGFARRIARNTSSLLTMEAHVARVLDPAGGSWYVERLTADLAAAGWGWFTEIERAGGMLAALDGGLVAERIERTWARRGDDLAHRRSALTGVSEFPNLAETPLLREPFPAPRPNGPGPGPSPGTGTGTGTGPGSGESGLPVRRYAQAFEALRDAADAQAARTGHRPAVFLATPGPEAATNARAGFAANLFQAGGLATPSSGTATEPATIAAGFLASGARIACLAASDRLYAEHAPGVAQALRAAGAELVLLAGPPPEPGETGTGTTAAVDGYVSSGVDALAVLRDVHRRLGIGAGDGG